MKGFKFRLQRVLELRESEKREGEVELAKQSSMLYSAEEHVERIKELQNSSNTNQQGVTTMSEIQLSGFYQAYLQRALEEQSLRVIEATQAVEIARDAYLERAMKAEALVRIKRKQAHRHSEKNRRRERKLTNELTIQRHHLRSIKSEQGEE